MDSWLWLVKGEEVEGEEVQMCKCEEVKKWETQDLASLRGEMEENKSLTQGREDAERWLAGLGVGSLWIWLEGRRVRYLIKGVLSKRESQNIV